jgi:hypothetical protein
MVRTVIYAGRSGARHWEHNRQTEIKELITKGIVPNQHELEKHPDRSVQAVTFTMGN